MTSRWFSGFLCVLSLFFSLISHADESDNSYVHNQSDGYEWPTDEAVLHKLDEWQDLKFGVLFHWGLYSVPGICESWPICSEDWITRPEGFTYESFKDWYWGQADNFNPRDFDPSQWAHIMSEAGMKYMIFTTKHHDGFCMFDTSETDFSIAKGPFHDDPRSDVALHVFNAFREKNFMVGAYFSKPDWHSKWFWNPYYATPNRMQNYSRDQHPDWWKNYCTFTLNQLLELTENYGPLDILWLDGGWISGEEIGLDEVLSRARSGLQPGLISVDRTIKGRHENYQTPERSIPDHQLQHPWESCIPLSDDWGWTPNPNFKDVNKIIQALVEVVAKGGCLLLGVGPTPQGLIQSEVADILEKVGEWLKINGEAIYSTRCTEHYNEGHIWFTQSKDGETRYAIYTLPENECLPSQIEWAVNIPQDNKIILLEGNRELTTSLEGNKVIVKIPQNLKFKTLAFKFRVER